MLRKLLTTLGALVFRRPAAAGPPREALSAPDNSNEGGRRMNAAYEKLIQHFEEHDISYLPSADHGSLCADFRGDAGSYRIVATVDAEGSLFQVYGYTPLRVPVGSRPAIGETIARANFGLKVGKFELDFDEGDLRFQAAQILANDSLEDETIRRLIGTAITMLDTYLPAVLSVIYGNELPQDAIRCAEARPSDSDGTSPQQAEE